MMIPRDILLVAIPPTNPMKDMFTRIVGTLPVGLASLAAVLVDNGYSVAGLDACNCRTTREDIAETMRSVRPRLIGISAATEGITNAHRVAQQCKAIDPSALVVLGGPHVSFKVEETLSDPAVDMVVRGEGEFAMLEIAECHLRGHGAWADIGGLSYRSQGVVRNNRARDLIHDLDELPLLQRSAFPGPYMIDNCVLTSRGCPGRCLFCAAAAMAGGRYRTRTAAHVIDEIVFGQSICVRRHVFFLDDTMTADHARFQTILRYMEALGLDLEWTAESRVDVVTEASLAEMARMGCIAIQFGVESGSQEVIDKIGKRITLEQVVDAVRWARATIKNVTCSFVIGLPFDTEETIEATRRFGLRMQNELGAHVLFSIATPYPGTRMYEHAEQLGLRNLSNRYDDYNFQSPVFDLPTISRQRLRNLQFDIMMEGMLTMPQELRENLAAKGRSWNVQDLVDGSARGSGE